MADKVISLLTILVFCILGLTDFVQARAADVDGVHVEDKVILDGGTPLVLNGAGIRHKFAFLKLYVGALYLPAKKTNAEEIISDAGAKRIAMIVLADEISARELVASLNNALAANHIPEELALIEARLRVLNRMMVAEGVLKKGAVVTLSYLPATGTHIRINSDEKLVIKGEDFFRALLRIWIGNRPVDGRLRGAMLGGTGSFTLF